MQLIDLPDMCNGGSTPLMLACQGGHAETVKILLEHGASINARDSIGGRAFDIAVKMGHAEICRIFLEGKEVNIGERDFIAGDTALHHGVRCYLAECKMIKKRRPRMRGWEFGVGLGLQEKLIRVLFDFDADPTLPNFYCASAWELVRDSGHMRLMGIFLDYYPGLSR